jgi:ribonuclease J
MNKINENDELESTHVPVEQSVDFVDVAKYKDKFLFIPLGGACEVGMNLNLYYHKGDDENGKWLIVDLGICFAEPEFPGVEITMPKIAFIEKRLDEVAGLVLTHAHEDHLGAVAYLWNRIKCPIYATAFTAEILKAKFREMLVNEESIPINIIGPNTPTQIGNFSVEMVHITHSIPEMHGLMIRTPSGNIFHTGDWKLDPDPVVGNATDEGKLSRLGDEGVLAMVSDSTNIFNHGSSGSEGDLKESLTKLIKKHSSGLVVVTTFASNIARLKSVSEAAKETGRKVVLVGRSLWRMYNAAINSGYLDDVEGFLEPTDIKGKKRSELLVISTGCQGEEMAAVNRIANHTHPHINMTKGDTIIFASKIIPGNEKRIYALFNKFCSMGVEVLSEMNEFVHVSGHPAQDEVRRMYELIRPQVAIPVHGDRLRLHLHAKFATSIGIQNSLEVENGSVVVLDKEHPRVVGKVQAGYLVLDGKYIIDGKSPIIRDRLEMQQNGIVFIVVVLDGKKGIRYSKVFAPGILDIERDKPFFQQIQSFINEHFGNMKIRNNNGDSKKIALKVKNLIKKERGKTPRVYVQII